MITITIPINIPINNQQSSIFFVLFRAIAILKSDTDFIFNDICANIHDITK